MGPLFLGGCLRGLLREHDDCHRRGIARTRTRLQDTQVTTRAFLEARTNFREELAYNFLVAQTVESETAVRDAVFLRERNERLDDTAQFFDFWQRRTDRF